MELKINKEKAKIIYLKADDWFRAELEEAFGIDFFRKKDFRDIKTFEDACNELELTLEDLLNIGNYDKPDEFAYKKLKIIVKAINQGWIPNWTNTDQRKWWPWFDLTSGFSFSNMNYNYDKMNTNISSHLCFESEEKAGYAGQQFLDLYKQFLT